MFTSILYLVLTLVGLGFLIFIHELGHYFMARHVGMKVEVFSIGFGKPIFTWTFQDVKWQVCWIPFGGYVKITGEQQGENDDPYDVPDGFFSKTPMARIKVAFMGPFVNLVFAFLAFSTLWFMGGREKPYTDFSSYIGWVDPDSELYVEGVRPGDQIESYDDHAFQSSKDHLHAAMIGDGEITVRGIKKDLKDGIDVPFEKTVKAYPHPYAQNDDVLTLGVLNSARFLVYDRFPDGSENPLQSGVPMASSGIEYGDRILWLDGEMIYSKESFTRLLNEERALLTVQRGNQVLLMRVPRMPLAEYKLAPLYKEELEDWQYEAKLAGQLLDLFFIPYNLTWDCVVETPFAFIDKEDETRAFPQIPYSEKSRSLLPHDRILAVDGLPVKRSYDLLKAIQERHVNVIVQKGVFTNSALSLASSNSSFLDFDVKEIENLAATIGFGSAIASSEKYALLSRIKPIMRKDLPIPQEKKELLSKFLDEQKKRLQEIDDPQKRAEALNLLEGHQTELVVGVALQDMAVQYNPPPQKLFGNVFEEVWRTLTALVTGYLNPKWLAGPIGIVQIIHYGWTVGIKEALFWLAAISLNLGVLNLLPIPILDGGSICFSLFEMISKRRLNPKMMERFILPFVFLLVGFFLYITYQDVVRILERFVTF